MERISRDELYMQIAEIVSLRGTCTRNSVGVVLVREGRIVGMGYNASPSGDDHCIDVGCDIGPDGGCQRTIHAELNSLLYMAKAGVSTKDITLYTTLSPCLTCSKAIIQAGVREVVYLSEYRDPEPINFLRKHRVITRHLPRNIGRPQTQTDTANLLLPNIEGYVRTREALSQGVQNEESVPTEVIG